MNATHMIRMSRAILRKFIRENRSIDLGVTGPRFKVNLKTDEPIETRSGRDITDNSPFYESNPEKLFAYYHGYGTGPECMDNVLYADIIPLKTSTAIGITLNAVHTDSLEVSIEPANYRIPEKLQAHNDLAIELFIEMKKLRWLEDVQSWENNLSLRVNSFDNSGKMSCRFARYFDQVGTNITIDWASGQLPKGGPTIRSSIERPINGRLIPLSDSLLANTLGVAVLLYDQALNPIFRTRSDQLASIPKRGIHCTASGVFDVNESQSFGKFAYALLEGGMVREIKREVGLERNEYLLYPIAFARELPRGGKPQLFFVAIATVDNSRIATAKKSAEEAYEFMDEETESKLAVLRSARKKSELFTYEGWACARFAELFIDANRQHFKAIINKDPALLN
jgi:hypothetical protein